MPIEYKDYYKVLGVARTASADEIRKAFRKLARQYHPDVAKNKAESEAKFKEINEAYEVLGDPENRKKYDELGPNWKAGADFRPPPGGFRSYSRGQEGDFEFQFGGTGFSDFFEQLFGARRNFTQQGRFTGEDFDETSGRGQDVESDILVTLHEALRGAVRPITLQRHSICPQCRGAGAINGRACPSCEGEGSSAGRETFQVRIPAGVREGQRLRIAGRGEPGSGRAASGDLYLRVRFEKHPDFRADEGDLHHELEIAPWEAVLGASVPVPTLEGHVNIKIPPGAQSGQRLRVRGHGLPKAAGERGDLYAILRIQVPEKISDRERKLWEQLATGSAFQPRG